MTANIVAVAMGFLAIITTSFQIDQYDITAYIFNVGFV
jgi:hypothetical protein